MAELTAGAEETPREPMPQHPAVDESGGKAQAWRRCSIQRADRHVVDVIATADAGVGGVSPTRSSMPMSRKSEPRRDEALDRRADYGCPRRYACGIRRRRPRATGSSTAGQHRRPAGGRAARRGGQRTTAQFADHDLGARQLDRPTDGVRPTRYLLVAGADRARTTRRKLAALTMAKGTPRRERVAAIGSRIDVELDAPLPPLRPRAWPRTTQSRRRRVRWRACPMPSPRHKIARTLEQRSSSIAFCSREPAPGRCSSANSAGSTRAPSDRPGGRRRRRAAPSLRDRLGVSACSA